MTDLFLDKYRISSIRRKGHDYTSPGTYFITINTDAKISWFGSVANGIMRLSPIGEIVREEWLKAENLRDNIKLDEWIIMPNHIHGIIKINESPVKTARWAVSPKIKDNINHSRTTTLKSNSIGSIIGQFKSVCTKKIRNRGFRYFKWQNRYYDHIIRNEKELHKIRSYIRLNPKRW
jgi:REP element-mobilizing transposase RayT